LGNDFASESKKNDKDKKRVIFFHCNVRYPYN
jgi:hypothetical protein